MFKQLSLCLSTSVLFAATLMAQTTTSGDITGTVIDPTKAVLANVVVTVTNNATAAAQKTVTNGQGLYRAPFLPPGSYTVSVTAPGLQTAKRAVRISVGQTATANIQLELAGSTTTVRSRRRQAVFKRKTPTYPLSSAQSNWRYYRIPATI